MGWSAAALARSCLRSCSNGSSGALTMSKKQRGVALVEFAITLPLLLAICFGITEFGRAIYTYNTLAKSTRDAARYLTTQAPGNAVGWATAKNLAVYGNPLGTGSPLVVG